jgi:glycosyltransferase involved in cell wall biosynthesis
MKLAFNVMNSGLGNNGGSRTILLCQKTLEKLGHQCDVIGSVDNFTWFKHKKIIHTAPRDLDAVLATACTTVNSTLSIPAKKKAWYIRGHEEWQMPGDRLGKLYNNLNLFNIANSEGLKQIIGIYGADAEVVYQGMDFDWWEDKKLRSDKKIRIGSLYNTMKTKRWPDFAKLSELLPKDKYEFVAFGAKPCKAEFLSEYKQSPSKEELCDLYSSCHIWFAPTTKEGLHNVPMEAAMCGCLVVCSDHPMNGMIFDYAFDNTAMIYESEDIDHAIKLIKEPDWSLVRNMQKYIRKNIGSREENMKKMIGYLEE